MIKDAGEREKLAKLNLEAGKKAKASAAYAPAFGYLQTGINLLGDQPWKNQYELTLALYTESTEAAYLMGDFDKMNELAETALQHARTALEKVKIYMSRINACTAREDFQGAIDVALPVLKLLGIHMPKKPSQAYVATQLIRLKIMIRGRKPEEFFNRPRMTDPEKLAAMQILASMGHAAFYADPNMLALIIVKTSFC